MSDLKLTLNCKGVLLSLEKPVVMGILNITPDSFYDGGKYTTGSAILKRVEEMVSEGVTIIDVGGMSSRPGAEIISLEEERRRVIPIVLSIKERYPDVIISVDTIRSAVAKESVEAGAHMINDISAGSLDANMYATIADLKVPYILMHMRGKPKNMQQQTEYNDLIKEILTFLTAEVGKLRKLGVVDIVVDPGFGFGKTLDQNYTLLKHLHIFNLLECPILAGISRKSMIYKLLESTPEKALNGTTALHMVALQQGAKILRTHDVREAVEVIKLWEQLEQVK